MGIWLIFVTIFTLFLFIVCSEVRFETIPGQNLGVAGNAEEGGDVAGDVSTMMK